MANKYHHDNIIIVLWWLQINKQAKILIIFNVKMDQTEKKIKGQNFHLFFTAQIKHAIKLDNSRMEALRSFCYSTTIIGDD